MARLTEFRTLDQVAVALERGVSHALDRVPDAPFKNLGTLVEAATLARVKPIFNDVIGRFAAPDILDTLRRAQAKPLTPMARDASGRTWGFMNLERAAPEKLREKVYAFELAARQVMRFPKNGNKAKALLCGALQEMVDNIVAHSQAVGSGIIGFCGEPGQFEMAIGDAGVGVLASLRSNQAFSFLQDAGTAMTLALADGTSRFGGSSERGYGFGILFRALNTLDADLRFRSDDYALEATGHSPTLRAIQTSQKATLQGFVVSLKLLF